MKNVLKIRKSVFETNSSSSHSLTVTPGELCAMPFDKRVLREGKLPIALGEFGWEWFRIYSTEGKIRYLATGILKHSVDDAMAELHLEHPQLEQLSRVIKDFTGVELEMERGSQGYIDHDSSDVFAKAFASDETLKQFIFGAESFVETSNDNCSAPRSIDTDRGAELYYAKSTRDPKRGSKITLTLENFYSDFSATLADGRAFTAEANADLVAELREKGTLLRAEYVTVGEETYFKYTDIESHALDSLVEDFEFFVANNFSAVETIKKTKDYSRLTGVVLTISLPLALKKRIEAIAAVEVAAAVEAAETETETE